ncbi:MAG: site-specific integrase [Chitinophagales bacterium]
MKQVTTDIYLDTRRPKKDGRYPVKLRVTFERKTRFFPLRMSFTEAEFETVWISAKPRGEAKEARIKLVNEEERAMDIVDQMPIFSFELFEKKFLGPAYAKGDVFAKYEAYIAQLMKNDQVGTASVYRTSKRSICKFLEKYYGLKTESFHFTQITENLLQEYENYILNDNGGTYSTVGINLRPLRTLFNMAREEGDIPADFYPFGKRKYQIPAAVNNKRPLEGHELKRLLQAHADPFEEKARDFFFLSYLCNGINMKDLAEMKFGVNLQEDQIVFLREKTKRTNKTNLKPIIVPLIAESKEIIEKYQNTDAGKKGYVFPIYEPGMTAIEKQRAVQNFTRFVNQHIKRLAEKANLGKDISTYWARHTFANTMQNNGASTAEIGESIGHSNVKTTANYLSGFAVEKKKVMAEKLMDFIKH